MRAKARRLTVEEIERLKLNRFKIETATVEPVELAVSRPRIVKGKKADEQNR